ARPLGLPAQRRAPPAPPGREPHRVTGDHGRRRDGPAVVEKQEVTGHRAPVDPEARAKQTRSHSATQPPMRWPRWARVLVTANVLLAVVAPGGATAQTPAPPAATGPAPSGPTD